jgi:hypothetical protein
VTGRTCPGCGGVLASDQDRCPACGSAYAPPGLAASRPLIAALVVLAIAVVAAFLAYSALRGDAEDEAARIVPVSSGPSAPAGAPDAAPPDPQPPGAG